MSGLYFKCGNYAHPVGEVTLTQWGWTVELSEQKVPLKKKYSCSIAGELLSTDSTALTAAVLAFERAYNKQNQDVGLFHENGTPTAHFLDSSKAIGGVRITGVVYPGGDTEYVTSRKFSATFEADYLITDGGANVVLEFSETLSFVGTGGPRTIFLFPLTGAPEKQTVQMRTSVKATQSGSSKGRQTYPPIPQPLFPADEHVDQRQISYTGPNNSGGDKTGPGVSWTYIFEFAAAPAPTYPHTQ